jgi:protein subunit release factor A
MELKPQDILVSVFSTTDSAWVVNTSGVRLYHKPTQIEVSCTTHKSQHRNRLECMRLLEEELCYLELGGE